MKGKKILFIYTGQSLTGINAKAAKIESGFRSAGYEVTARYFGHRLGWLRRACDLISIWAVAGAAILSRRYDVIFIRYAYYFIPLYLLACVVPGNIQVEVNSDSKAEMRNRGQHVRARLDDIAIRAACRGASRVHAVSRFLGAQLLRRFPKAKIVFTPNFVVDEYYVEKSAADSEVTNIVFLGNTAQIWHGIPRFLAIIAALPEFGLACKFHVIGHCSPDVDEIINRFGIRHIVTKHGFVDGPRKHSLMSNMHIGVSGFALDAIGLTETTGIKIGEYLHAGLAVLLGYTDPAIDPGSPFTLTIDANADAADNCKRILDFATVVRTNPTISVMAHNYARRRLLVQQYVESIVREPHGG